MVQDNRPWLVVIHCVNHRLELAMKDAFKTDASFAQFSETLFSIWHTFKY